jgi:excisionase family DNA binding protein
MQPSRESQLVFSIGDACELTGLTRHQIRCLIQTGKLKTLKIGGYNKITRATLSPFIEEVGGRPLTAAAA